MAKRSLPGVDDRPDVLRRRRDLKMARSPHAYVRGNTVQFYEWLKDLDSERAPRGPAIWICGDCHAGNIGPVADADGNVLVQIRDLDQTVIGSPAHDIIRLGLSLASAARGSNLPGVTTARILEAIIEGYEGAFSQDEELADLVKPESVKFVLRLAAKRRWRHLARERLEDTSPRIPLGKRFWPITSAEAQAIEYLMGDDEMQVLAKLLRSRDDDAKVRVVDAAYWMKGCSSLGLLRYAVLLGVSRPKSSVEDLCLMDIKEAGPAAAPTYAGCEMPADSAERVVAGAQHLSPLLGERMRAATLLDRPVFVRELLPQDLKVEIDQLSHTEAMLAARYLAAVVGIAHARQMNDVDRRSWREALQKRRSVDLDAPSWLWTSVVELLVNHEGAYLEHCRTYALEPLT